jgi:N-methylhydantoinase B
MSNGTGGVDPVTLEVIRNALPAISNEMSYDLQRTSYNMMIYEVRDYSCTLVDSAGRLLSQNIGGVSHFISDMGVVIQDGIAKFGGDGFAPGDIVIMNHQAVAGQHLNNVVIYAPFFYKGAATAFPAVRAHWVDIGGVSTGFGGGTDAVDPWIEGLQLNQLKIYERGQPDRKLLQMIRDNIRFPEAAMGDLRSQIAACRLAERRLDELYGRYGPDTIGEAIKVIFAQTEKKCRAVVEQIPDGVYEADNYIEQPAHKKEPIIHIHVKVAVRGSDMEIDFSGSSPQRDDTMNSRTLAAPYIAYKALTTPLEPVNEGSFAALKAIIPEGSIMMARFPAPMANWSSVLPGAVDTVFKALAPAMPDRIPAGHLGYMGIGRSFTAYDARRKRTVVLQTIDGGGWGGRPNQDGPSASVTICQGDVRNAPIESMELKAPVIVEERGLIPDSGGPGQYRGGLGLRLQVRALADGRWGLPPHRRCHYPPWGLHGGKPGRGGANWVKIPQDADWRKQNGRIPVPADSLVRAETTGGGGWGDPLARDPQRVLFDVVNGYITREGARADYGVLLDDTEDKVNSEATAALRAHMKAKEPSK